MSNANLNGQPSTSKEQKAAVALLWLNKACAEDKWDLNREELGIILGSMPKRTLSRNISQAEQQGEISVSRDTFDRMSLLLGIHKALTTIAPSGYNFKFFGKPNAGTFLQGKSIKQFLLEDGSMESLYTVRNYVSSLGA